MQNLATLGGSVSIAYGVNNDGSVIVGDSRNRQDAERAFRWTAATGMLGLQRHAGVGSSSKFYAHAVNGNGSVVVGESNLTGAASQAFRWTEATGIEELSPCGGTRCLPWAVSRDGRMVVGEIVAGDGSNRAFRWTAATGVRDLNALLADAGVNMADVTLLDARGMSEDGQFIVGADNFAGAQRAYIVRYDDGAQSGAPEPSPR